MLEDLMTAIDNMSGVEQTSKKALPYPDDNELSTIVSDLKFALNKVCEDDIETANIINFKHAGYTYSPEAGIYRVYVEGYGFIEINKHGLLLCMCTEKLVEVVEGVDTIVLHYSDYVSELASWNLTNYKEYQLRNNNSPYYKFD